MDIISSEQLSDFEREDILNAKKATGNFIKMSDEAYFSDKSLLSNSTLNQYVQGGLYQYLKYIKGEHSVTSDALSKGTMIHKYLLEPELFWDEYFFFDDTKKCIEISGADWQQNNKKPRNTKAYKEWYVEKYQPLVDQGKIAVSLEDLEFIEMIESKSLLIEPIKTMIQNSEKELVVTGKFNGWQCKGKIDGLIHDSKKAYDIKTTSKPIPEFIHSIKKYGYDRAAALYTELGQLEEFTFIVFQTVEPYGVGVFDCSPEFLENGKNSLVYYMNKLKTELDTRSFNQIDELYHYQKLI